MKKVQGKIKKEEIYHSKFGYGIILGKRGTKYLCRFEQLSEDNTYQISVLREGFEILCEKNDFERCKGGFFATTKLHFQTGTGFDPTGFDIHGYSVDGYDKQGYNKEGYNKQGYDKNGYNKEGYDKNGYTKQGYDKNGKTLEQNELIKNIESYESEIIKKGWLEGERFLEMNGMNPTIEEVLKAKKIKLQSYLSKYPEIYKNPLSENQKLFLIDFSPRILLQARAGSGKTTTLIQKTHFLLNECDIKKEEVIFLAFNKSAVKEVNARFEPFRMENAMTFHSLAGRIGGKIEEEIEQSTDEKDEIDESSYDTDFTLKKSARIVIQELFKDEKNRELVYQIFKSDKSGVWSSPEYEEFINNKGFSSQEYYEIVRGKNHETLDGKFVKSKAEKWIGDFLFEHDISYNYEKTEQFENKKKDQRGYSPDFQLTLFLIQPNFIGRIQPEKVWIEFWGIDENDSDKKIDPTWDKSWDQYREEMEWKRNYWKEKPDNILIELSITDIDYWNVEARGLFESKIKATLEKNGIICNKLPKHILINKVVENFKTKLEKLMEQFINRCKQRKWSPKVVSEKIFTNPDFNTGKVGLFYQFAIKCYELYEKKLKKEGLADFNDILRNATEHIHKEGGDISINISKKLRIKTNLKDIKYLMIDEYQDFSQLYYELVSVIIKYNPDLKIICVGDDWQLINGFSGSQELFYNDFERYFPSGKRLNLLHTWRCPYEIVDTSNQLMEGLGKGTICGKKHHGKISGKYIGEVFIECRKEEKKDYEKDTIFFSDKKKAEKRGGAMEKERYLKYCCEIILQGKKNNKENEFLIMSPFNETPFLKEELVNTYIRLLQRDYNLKDISIAKEKLEKDIVMQTVHKSKGAQADICIILQVGKKEGSGNTKFPFLHPDHIFGNIFGDTPVSVLEEQRRLFYVALTRTKKDLYFISESEFSSTTENFFLLSSFNEGYTEYLKKSGNF